LYDVPFPWLEITDRSWRTAQSQDQKTDSLTPVFVDAIGAIDAIFVVRNRNYRHILLDYHIDTDHLEYCFITPHRRNHFRRSTTIISVLNLVHCIMVSDSRGICNDSYWPSQNSDNHPNSATSRNRPSSKEQRWKFLFQFGQSCRSVRGRCIGYAGFGRLPDLVLLPA